MSFKKVAIILLLLALFALLPYFGTPYMVVLFSQYLHVCGTYLKLGHVFGTNWLHFFGFGCLFLVLVFTRLQF